MEGIKSKVGSEQALLENGIGKAVDSKSSNNAKNILMVILGTFSFLLLVLLLVMIFTLNNKVNLIEEQQSLVDIKRQQESGLSVSDKVESDHSDGSKISGKGMLMPTNGVHLTGIRSFQSMNDDFGNGMETIRNWQGSGADGTLLLRDNSKVMVEEDGLFMIYAQISWRMKQGTAVFEISKKDKESTEQAAAVSLSKCISNFDVKYAVMKTCFTSTTANLKRGDSVQIMVLRDNFSIDFNDGKSFFGIVRMDQVDSSKFT